MNQVNVLEKLTAFLRERKANVIRKHKVEIDRPAMTEGFTYFETIAEIEVIDFDALMNEIDAFSASFKSARREQTE